MGKANSTRIDGQHQVINGPQTNITDGVQGPVLSGKFGEVVFNMFGQASVFSRYIRVREFRTLVNERTRGFVGRDFIFQAIDRLIQDPLFPSGYIVIRGEPGIGKTSLIAQLVKSRGYVHHFNIATQNIRSAQDFLQNLCAQLVVRYELDYAALPPEAIKDSGFLLQLIEDVVKFKHGPLIVLLDALDEAEDSSLAPNTNFFYLPQSLPEGVFFVITTREQTDYRLFVDRREDIYLHDDNPANLEDVRQYIRNYVQDYHALMAHRIREWGKTDNEFVDIITEKSQGNFMYLVYVLRDIRDGKITATNLGNVRELPQGLRAYYQRHWRVMRAQDAERFDKYYQPVVCLLATAQESVSVALLAEWTELAPSEVSKVIEQWREFLNVDRIDLKDEFYRLYHSSFQEFLKDQVGLLQYHDMIATTALGKIKW